MRQTSLAPVGFEHTISAVERTQTHSLDRSATGVGEADDIPRTNYVKCTLSCDLNGSMSFNNTSQQDFGTRKVYCVSNVTFHAESKHANKIFPSPTVFVQWTFKLLIFRNFWYFHQIFLYMNKYFKWF